MDNNFSILNIIPDININNSRVQTFLTNIHSYRNIFEYIKDKKEIQTLSYEIYLSKDNIKFFFVTDKYDTELIKGELNLCFPRATVNTSEDYLKGFRINKCCELGLKEHSFLSLNTDKRSEDPLASLLEISKMLKGTEKIYIQVLMIPENTEFNRDCKEYIRNFNQYKKIKKRLNISFKDILNLAFKGVLFVDKEILSLIKLFITNDDKMEEWDNLDELEYEYLINRGLSENTRKKAKCLMYDTNIRIAVNSDDKRTDLLIRMAQNCFSNLNGDNELVEKKVEQSKLKKVIKDRDILFKINSDDLSTLELSQIIQLPTRTYQQLYNLQSISISETEIPKVFTKPEGIELGNSIYKGKRTPIFLPLNNPDYLCRTYCCIGEMNTGKTTAGENMAIQLLKNNVGVIAIDVADGRLVDNIIKGTNKDFKKSILLDFGDIKHPIPLNWSEIGKYGTDFEMETRIASQLKNFLNKLAHTETSDRMERYLGAVSKAVFKNPNSNLYDVIKCLTDIKFRHKVIEENNIVGRIKETLLQLDDKNEGTKTQYISGIMDRLEALLDNEYAANCLLQKPNVNIDFRKWLDEGYFVGVKVPKDILLDDATDLLVTYIVSKLWLAVLTRRDTDIDKRKPAFLILDEPHQFPSVLNLLNGIVREQRKWRLGTILLAHHFQDFGYIKDVLKSAGTNYIIYNTSKNTYNELLEELSPFTLEELMKTKLHYAAISLRWGSEKLNCIAEMLKPIPKNNNCKVKNVYGRNIEEVYNEIYQ